MLKTYLFFVFGLICLAQHRILYGQIELRNLPNFQLNVDNGAANSAFGGGYLLVGSTDIGQANLGLDENSIQARLDGGISSLFIQKFGGNTILNETNGSVGIGTTSPDANHKLDVSGNTRFDGKVRIGTNEDSSYPLHVKMSNFYGILLDGMGTNDDWEIFAGIVGHLELWHNGVHVGSFLPTGEYVVLTEKGAKSMASGDSEIVRTERIRDRDPLIRKLQATNEYLLKRLNELEQMLYSSRE